VPVFRRKSADVVADVADSTSAVEETDLDERTLPATRGYTPPKGRETPKRVATGRRVVAEPTGTRKEMAQRRREAARAERAEATEGMRRGDEKYMLPRDKGPERLLVRDLVDRRRTVGTWFFGGALIVIVGSSAAMPPVVRLGANILWVALAVALIVDAVLIARSIRKRVRAKYPNTTQRMGSLYLYGIMRSITFRRMRIPKPRLKIGDKLPA